MANVVAESRPPESSTTARGAFWVVILLFVRKIETKEEP
jgi:hypothetical protein